MEGVATGRDVGGRAWTGVTTSALLLGVAHALVDAASGFIIFRDVGSGHHGRAWVLALVVLYNAIAFGGQAPLGHLADRVKDYRSVAGLGLALAATALGLAPAWTLAGVVVVGVGNALFHVGAGAAVLAASGDRSTEAGVFVGPGAVGLFAGLWLGGGDAPARWPLAALLVAAIPVVLRARASARLGAPELRPVGSKALVVASLCALALCGSVFVRSLVGGAVGGSWRGVSAGVMLGLAAAACAGKMLGGFVSDRLGWTSTSVLALVLSAPLVSLFVGHPACAILGMLVFQMTMPVTLKAVHHLLPTRPGLAFGLPCAALLFGALPGLSGLRPLGGATAGLLAVGGSAILVTGGLAMLPLTGASRGRGREVLRRLVAR